MGAVARVLPLQPVRSSDHDPASLEVRADRLDAAADALLAGPGHARVVREMRLTAALLRRLADDIRIVEEFLRGARLLAPRDGDEG